MIIPSPNFAVWALNALQKSMMLTPCWPRAGPTGGAGVAFPAGMCSLTNPAIFLTMQILGERLELLHLQEIELDGRGAPEDGHHHLDRGPVVVDLVHETGEIRERPVDDADRVAPLEVELRLRLFRRHRDLVDDPVHLFLGERRRLLPRAHEAGHLRSVLDHVPSGVVHLHVDQHVSREKFLLGNDLGAVPHLHDVLRRDQDFADLVLHPERLGPLLEALADLVLVAGIGMHDVPLLRHARHRPQPACVKTQLTIWNSTVSTTHRNSAKMKTVTMTTVVVPRTSFQDGHDVRFSSARISDRNVLALCNQSMRLPRRSRPLRIWQARRDSNPQHPVLETGALAVRATGLDAGTRLQADPRHFVSLWSVCALHQRQNFLNSSFSVVFLRFFVET